MSARFRVDADVDRSISFRIADVARTMLESAKARTFHDAKRRDDRTSPRVDHLGG